jgi:hypothetical protein
MSTTFLEIILRSDEFNFGGRDEIEEPLEEALAAAQLGEVTGGGGGNNSSNIDVEVTDLAEGLELIKRVLRAIGVGPSTIINQYEPDRVIHHVWDNAPPN